jgi:glycosyltransferase involved in cell wall biosynthesis
MAKLYRSAWVYCLPSTYEGYGLTYLEALGSGTASVVTDNPAAREAFGDPPAGLLLGDASLGQSLVRVLTDRAERRRLEAAGLARSRNFTWEQTLTELLSIYRAVAGA